MRAMLIDDEPTRPQVQAIREVLTEEGVDVDKGYVFLGRIGANDFCKRVKMLERPPEIAIVDYSLRWTDIQGDSWNGDRVGKYLRKRWAADVPFYIIFVSAYLKSMESRYEQLVELLRVPFTGFVELGAGFEESIRNHVRYACDLVRAERARSIAALNALPEGVAAFFGDKIVGTSPSLIQAGHVASRVSRSSASILLTGESGTGKELVAKAIHFNSPRANEPFVAINCAAIPDTLIESELFGHTKGAFTGAVKDQQGQFARANGGTLFLDEVGEMPAHAQVKLLRVLQEREIVPVGSSTRVPIDVRVISATHRVLPDEISEGRFREDLYYRLKVIEIPLPPLRDRGADVLDLAEHFLSNACRREGLNIRGFSEATKRTLLDYSWPGNARQLQNAVDHAALMCEGELIEPGDLPQDLAEAPESSENDTWKDQLRAFKRRYFQRKYTEAGGNKTRAAELAEVSRRYFIDVCQELDID